MDKIFEYNLFSTDDQLREEFEQTKGENNDQQITSSELSKNDNWTIRKNKNQKHFSSNDLITLKNLKSRKLMNYVNNIDKIQQKQDEISLQQQRNSANLLSRNAMSPNNGYKADIFKNQQQSYSQTLQNYKWIQFIPQSIQSNYKTDENQYTSKLGMFQQEQNFQSSQNIQKANFSGPKQKLSNSAVYLQPNLPITPHERVMRIKNKQKNLDVLRYINNPILGENNSLFDNDLDIFANSVEQGKNNSLSQDKIIYNSSQIKEQNTKTKENLHPKKFDYKLNNINTQIKKTQEYLFNSSKTNIENKEIDSQKEKVTLKDSQLSPQIQQKQTLASTLNVQDKYKQNIQNSISLNNKDKGLNNIKLNRTQSHSAAWRIYKRGVNFHKRGSSNQLQSSDKIDKSPIQKFDGTWSHSFYRFSNELNKQAKTIQKKEKSQDFEDFLQSQISPHSKQKSIDKNDQIPNVTRMSYLNNGDEYDVTATPQNNTNTFHKQKETNKFIQMQKQNKEQFKNIHLLLNFEHLAEQHSPLRKQPFLQSKVDIKKHSLSNTSNRFHIQTPKSKEMQKVQSDQEKDKDKDIKRETFLSNFPIQIQTNQFIFSKLNIKRKNPQHKQNTFKL